MFKSAIGVFPSAAISFSACDRGSCTLTGVLFNVAMVTGWREDEFSGDYVWPELRVQFTGDNQPPDAKRPRLSIIRVMDICRQ